MEVSIISPPALLELSAIVDRYHMVLPAGIVSSEDYVRFYRDLEGYKILDNGIVEGTQYDGTELNNMARQVGANCIVVPDKYRSANVTISLARDFKRHVNPELHYMGVLQGETLTEYLKCLYFYDHTDWITHIGLPRIMCEHHKLQRVTFVETMRRMQKEGDLRRELKFHALGGSPWVQEVAALNAVDCDGMDTSLPVVLGLEGKSLTDEYISRQADFMERDIERNTIRWRVTVDNCTKFLEWGGVRLGGAET